MKGPSRASRIGVRKGKRDRGIEQRCIGAALDSRRDSHDLVCVRVGGRRLENVKATEATSQRQLVVSQYRQEQLRGVADKLVKP
jgi:hypothetical protein